MHIVPKHLGFTGTDRGLAGPQLITLRNLLSTLRIVEGYTNFHHGDCIGGDDQADRVARNRGYSIDVHPPTKGDKRAHCDKKVSYVHTIKVHKAKRYLRRDDDIAKQTLALVACPHENHIEVQRSGVWATVRYARKYGRKIYIIWPDGKLTIERSKYESRGHLGRDSRSA